jgi:TPR repeat protein
MKKIFSLICICFCLCGCVTEQVFLAKSYQKGKNAFDMKQYRTAFTNLYPVAESGNPDAQYAIGYLYFYGDGIVEDKNLAHYWMSLAARQGQPKAIRALREM